MAEITATLVKQLRDATNVSMMECKRALQEADGDIGSATRILRERGMAIAAKKSSRATNQGLVASVVSDDSTCASLVEVNCETDFVARNPDFVAFVNDLAGRACSTDEALGEQVKEELTAKIAEIGENLVVNRNMRYVLEGKGRIASYIHLGAKVGVLIDAGCGKDETVGDDRFKELVKDLTLHVAACGPAYLVPEEVPAEEADAEREIYRKQVENKPPQIVEKIVEGKLRKHFAEVCLLEQPYVKEPKQSVKALLSAVGKELGDELTIRRFARYQLGE